ncbi:MAG: helix-turn-helix domain-containing protein [Synergistaceae bacterium]|nr:helix-turn-helix domain-containing protein [Synergistaceae bacterium]
MTHNKTVLLTRINSLRKGLDELVDLVIAIEEPQPEQTTSLLPPESDAWLTPRQVCKHLNIAYATFFEWVRTGKLPLGREFSSKSKRWRMSDIRLWQEERQNSILPVKIVVSEVAKRRGRPPKVRRKEDFYSV